MNIINLAKHFLYLYKESKIKKSLGHCGIDCNILPPILLGKPQNVFIEDYTLIQPNCQFIIVTGKFILKKWSSLSCGCTVITGNHKPTVGINQRLIARLHINDREQDIIVEEDCWIGANVTLLSGALIRRGAVVGTGALINKEIPPYAVVVGIPARIIGVKFSKEQILQHEKNLYPEKLRMKEDELNILFEQHYKNAKVLGTDYISNEDLEKCKKFSYMQYQL